MVIAAPAELVFTAILGVLLHKIKQQINKKFTQVLSLCHQIHSVCVLSFL